MRILQIHNRYRQPGGEDAVVDAEAGVLRGAGHDVCEYTVANPDGAVASAARLAIAPWNPAAARRLGHVVDAFEPDVAHVHNTWFGLSPAVLRTLHQRRVATVMTLHNYRLMCANALLFRNGAPCELCVGTDPWSGVKYRCHRNSLISSAVAATTIEVARRRGVWDHDVDLFLALTPFMRSLFVAAGLDERKISIKPNFVPDPGPRPTPPSASNAVLFVGRLSPEKGLDTVLRAWPASPRPLELLVIGDGSRPSGHPTAPIERVRFLGPLPKDDVVRHMLTARALLFPSQWYEGLPMVLLEAYAAGLPVLGSDLGSTRDVLDPIAGWRVPPGDIAAWETALGLLADGDAVDDAAGAVRAEYLAYYTPSRGVALLEYAYESAAASAAAQ